MMYLYRWKLTKQWVVGMDEGSGADAQSQAVIGFELKAVAREGKNVVQ